MHDNSDKFPNLFMVGAAKAGTTSLYEYLIQHPDIFGLENEKKLLNTPYVLKEPCFFVADYYYEIFQKNGWNPNWLNRIVRDRKTYLELYSYSESARYKLDASTMYLCHEDVPLKILKYSPHAKIIISLRNPVYGVYSLYSYFKKELALELEGISFEEMLKKDRKAEIFEGVPEGYKRRGVYFKDVKNYIDTFGRKNVKILIFEEWKKDTLHALEDICYFLEINRFPFKNTNVIHNLSGIPKDNFSVNLFKKLVHTQNSCKTLYRKIIPINTRKIIGQFTRKHLLENNLQKLPMKEETKQYLKEYYREDIAKLEELLGRDLSIWYNEK